MTAELTKDQVKDYYGKVLKTNNDLKTTACCTADSVPAHHYEILKQIHPEILEKFYGCGTPMPQALEGATVLDLGCGTGRDVYLASKLVGESGFVYGIDMTDEQLEIANRHLDHMTETFGFSKPNVEFQKGYIEKLEGIADNSIDLVISNCVINLSPDKPAVFSEIFRVLKPSGEMYISDVFANRRVPKHLREDPVLYGECLTGAMYMEDFRRCLQKIGVQDYRVVTNRKLEMTNAEVAEKVGKIDFYSTTVRAFKLDLEDLCEDYGQIATYKGNITETPNEFVLDKHHVFETDKPKLVCGNTADMLSGTRYAKYFNVKGDKSKHFGIFECSGPEKLSDEGQGCC